MEHQPEKEKDLIFGQLDEIRQIEMEGYQIGVRRARNALFWVAGIVLVGEIISVMISKYELNIYGLAIVIAIAAIFTGLGFWTRVKPYTALILGLIAYIGYIVLTVVVNSMLLGAGGLLQSLFSGIIVKVIIIIMLARGIPDARKLQNMMNEQQ